MHSCENDDSRRLLSPVFPGCEERPVAEFKEQFEMLARNFKKLLTTSEKLLSMPMDVLAQAYNDASIVNFWLPSPANDSVWPGPWDEHQVNNPLNKERAVIQPFIKNELAQSFPVTSPYVLSIRPEGWMGRLKTPLSFFVTGPKCPSRRQLFLNGSGRTSHHFRLKLTGKVCPQLHTDLCRMWENARRTWWHY
jgi:hypothetical protein